MDSSKQQICKNKNTETKYFDNIRNNRILKVKNSFRLVDREMKIRRKIEELFLNQLMSIDDMDKFEEKEIMRKDHLLKALGASS